jgi:hypothetical protein
MFRGVCRKRCRPSTILEVLEANICECVTIILDSGEAEKVKIKKIRKCLLVAEVNDCHCKYVDIRKITAVIVHKD